MCYMFLFWSEVCGISTPSLEYPQFSYIGVSKIIYEHYEKETDKLSN